MDTNNPKTNNIHIIYATILTMVAFIMLGILLYVVNTRSQADTSTQSAAITNASPTIDTINIATSSLGSDSSTFTLTESTTTTIYVHGTATDTNSCGEIDSNTSNWAGAHRLYRTTVTNGSTCTAGDANCYAPVAADVTITGCTLSAGDTTETWQSTDTINFYADATDTTSTSHSATNWTAYIVATDDSAATGTSTDTVEMNTLFALSVDGTVTYATTSLGANSAEITDTITNSGNEYIDVNISVGGTMSCTGPGTTTIPAANGKYSTATGAIGTKTDLTTSAVGINTNLIQGASSTATLYFQLAVPSTGVGGTCSNTITYTAVNEA
mgnify:FL=1